jgi:hypothetical protein
MNRKFIAICSALAALAVFALPTVASASPELTQPTGTRLAVGTKIKGTNVGNSVFKTDDATTSLAECGSTVLTGEVVKNNGTEVEGTITTATASGTGAIFNEMSECTGSFGNFSVTSNSSADGESVASGTPWCISAGGKVGADEFQLRGGKCSEAARAIRFIYDLTGPGILIECKYKRVEAVKGTFTTDSSGDALLKATAGPNTTVVGEVGNHFLCPVSGTFEVSYTLEADEATAKPLYAS